MRRHDCPPFPARLALSLAALACGSVASAQIYVKPGGAGTGSGTSWANAATLNNALGIAASSSGADQIWVAQGTYVPGATRSSTFTIPSETRVYGGFDGTESLLSQRKPSLYNLTILSGNVDGLSSTSGDAYNVVTVAPSGGFGLVIDGFKITLGNANGSAGSGDDQGGGLTIPGTVNGPFYVDVAVGNVTFEDNLGIDGAGMHAGGAGRLEVESCTFRSNTASGDGGGLHLNEAGSGIYCDGDGVKIFNTLFDSNEALQGGGLWTGRNEVTSWLYNCQFHDNVGAAGAAIHVGPIFDPGFYVKIGNCTIAYNVGRWPPEADPESGPSGAGIYIASSAQKMEIFNTIIWANVCDFGGIISLASSIEGPGASSSGLTVEYSDIEIKPTLPGGGPYWPGAGNINSSPVFVNAAARNFNLDAFSPCTDSGDDTLVPFDYLDLDGDLNMTEQVPRDFKLTMVREDDDAGVTDTGVDDLGTNSYSECGTSGGGAAPLDSGVVDMGCHERRLDS